VFHCSLQLLYETLSYSDNTLRELYVGYTQDVHIIACISLCEMTVILVRLNKKIKLDMPSNL
jgi:hypothetical protein